MKLALTRDVSDAIANCELTHLARAPIDLGAARAQHRAYEQALNDAGYRVERLAAGPDLPDSVFIEDVAVVLPELAIVTRPGAAARRGEIPAVADALGRYRPLRRIEAPGTIDGGDVLTIGRRVYVGVSTRTNLDAIAQMRRILAPDGYSVFEVEVKGCLHLKSAVTALNDDVLLVNPAWLPRDPFVSFERLSIDPSEPMAANALRLSDRIVYPSAFPRTADRIAVRGFRLACVDVSELAKAEGAVTCCSLILET